MVILWGEAVSYSEVTLYAPCVARANASVSAKYTLLPEGGHLAVPTRPQTNPSMRIQWLQRHPKAGSSWPSWPRSSYPARPHARVRSFGNDTWNCSKIRSLQGYLTYKKTHPPRTLP